MFRTRRTSLPHPFAPWVRFTSTRKPAGMAHQISLDYFNHYDPRRLGAGSVWLPR